MIDFKKILAAVKITNKTSGKNYYLLKNFDRFLDEENKTFLKEKFLTSHSGFFEDKNPKSQNYQKKIFYKKNFNLEENFKIEYLYLNNFFDKNKNFIRTDLKNFEKLKENFTNEIRSNFFFTESSFFYLTDEKFNTISTYRISPKNFHIGLNNFKNTPLKKYFKGSFFIYPFQILEKKFLNYITEKIDSYLGNTKLFSKEEFTNPVKNTNYVNFFSQKYEFFAYLKFKEVLEEIFLEKFGANLKKNYINLNNRFLRKNENKIIRFEDEFLKTDTEKNKKQFGFLEYLINTKNVELKFKYIFGDKIKENNSHFLEEDFSSILGKKFKNNSLKLTPDITLEISDEKNNINEKIFFDVKFSSFKDFDLKLDYPNPKYFKSDLHKYRKIGYKNNKQFLSKANKIFLIYPGNINKENFEEFKKLNHLVEKSYNIVLIPIYHGFGEKIFLKNYLKEIFTKEIKNLLNK